MFSRKHKHILLKFFSMFSVVRGYNILIIVLAQYLTAAFILAHNKPIRDVVLDWNLLLLVLASAAAIAGGYIINNFYDSEKDLINRPQKSMLDRLVSKNTKLKFYFILNFVAVLLASFVSFKAVLFFSIYIFAIWLYSHKLKKMPIVGNLVSAVLAITPFFAIFIYYKNFSPVIFVHATFLFLIIAMRELVKDLENLKGDLAQGYQTIPIVYGEKTSKIMLFILTILTFAPILILIQNYQLGNMKYYFYICLALLVIFVVLLKKSKTKNHYVLLHNMLKFIIVTGVFCIVLIDSKLLLQYL